MNSKSLAVTFSFLLLIINLNASTVCNESILLRKGKEILSESIIDYATISEGQNLSIPQFNSNEVFVYSILHNSNNHVTYTFDEEYTVTAVGIRQLFGDKQLEEICPKSLFNALESIYNISYKVSSNEEFQFLDYPIGTTGMGRVNPWVTLPYQKVPKEVTKETLKIAVIPTRVRTIKIQKETEFLDGVISNGGTYCLQFDLYGCRGGYDAGDQHSIVLEYQMPEPADSSDDGYTGLCSENYCTGGVGKLADESIGGESETVFWDINSTEIVKNIQFGNTSVSILQMLFIFDNVHYIEKINIFTFKPNENAIPKFITANGILFETSNEISSTSHVTLSPWINTNSILLEFIFYDSEDQPRPRIAISEVSFVEYTKESFSPPNDTTMVGVITLGALSMLLLISLCVSVTANFILVVKQNHGKKRELCKSSNTNHFNKQMEDEMSAYETISEDRNRYSTVYTEPDPELPVRSFNPNVSIIEMPSNPTYVSTLPENLDENLPGYSRLDFSVPTENKSEEKDETPVMRERPKSKILTASQRRSSYLEQHVLSELK